LAARCRGEVRVGATCRAIVSSARCRILNIYHLVGIKDILRSLPSEPAGTPFNSNPFASGTLLRACGRCRSNAIVCRSRDAWILRFHIIPEIIASESRTKHAAG
jgi:hypothetical protein